MNVALSLLSMALAGPADGPGCGPNQPCPPAGPPAPVLAARVLAPAGVKVTLLPGTTAARTFAAPVTAGFRPGYCYRLALTDLPNHPGEAVYPVLEVRGSIIPRPGMAYMDFPAPVFVTQGDIDKVVAGALVTKVVYLEDPTKALPIESKPDEPIELGEATTEDAIKAAVDNGRLVAVLRLGDRRPDADELVRVAVRGTVLVPGDAYLPAPAAPPLFQWCGQPLFDPILGPKPLTEECITDGGDAGPRIGIGPRGRVGGLDPTDVALEYTAGGKRRVATSNRVCVCAPRFAIRRFDLYPGGLRLVAGIDAVTQLESRVVISSRAPAQGVVNREKPVANVSRVRPGIMVTVNGVQEFVGLTRPVGVATVSELRQLVVVVEPEEITSFPNELTVTKEVDPAGPVKPGDEVTFTLRYRNNTPQPATDLLLSDSLSGRLGYVAGTAQSDRPTNVTTVDNEAGSVVVQFEIPGPVPPGQGGVVKFRAKVR